MTNAWRDHVRRLLVGLPVLSLALAALAWLRYGIDLPWFDDWRGYATGTIDSLEWHYLFQPMNDTMSPVGFTLDALAQRFLDGNSIAYQFISMLIVLGSLLVLQWNLLSKVADNSLQVGVCFLFTLLMLQPDSYWGRENLAYYQALPLVFILWAMLLMSRGSAGAWRGPAVAALGLLAGFSYISGAFGALAVGVTSLLLTRLLHSGRARSDSMRDWSWFLVAGAATAAVQFYFSVLPFLGARAAIPLALPTEAQFWAFYLGKLGRSLLLPPSWPWSSLLVTVLACVIALVSATWIARRAVSQVGTAQERQLASIYLPIGALVLVYLMLVAAGRTNFRPPEIRDPLQIFAYGFTRFHFFWATLIWPWVAVAVLVLCSRNPWLGRVDPARALAFATVFSTLVYLGAGLDHMSKMQGIGEDRTNMAHCLLKELQKGGEVRCPGLLPPRLESAQPPDSLPAYLYAKKIGASFVRNFPILPLGKQRETITPFYQFDSSSAKPRMHELDALGNGSFRSVGSDPQLYIQTNKPQITRRCVTMDVDIEIKVSGRDTLQLFYVPAGNNEEYSERNVVTETVGTDGGSLQMFSFRLESATGFFESMRLDPVSRPQVLAIPNIKAYCVRQMH